MQRTKNKSQQAPPAPPETDPSLERFQKIGGGSMRLVDGRIIKPNQVFRSKLSDIPKAFSDVVIRLDVQAIAEAANKKVEQLERVKPLYELKEVAVGWWTVINIDGKKINEKNLRKSEAEALLTSLLEA